MTNTNHERSWMEKYAPPGINLSAEVMYYIVTMTISTFWSFQFFLRYLQERNSLFEWKGGKKVLMEGAVMPSFEHLTENLFLIFGLVLIYAAAIAVYHYFYHYQGSKMMYLMKRLPDKWEVHKRCLILPVGAFVVAVGYMMLLKALYYVVYLFCTPSQCLFR